MYKARKCHLSTILSEMLNTFRFFMSLPLLGRFILSWTLQNQTLYVAGYFSKQQNSGRYESESTAIFFLTRLT